MKKINIEEATNILYHANENLAFVDDEIGNSILSILRGPHKTYRYILLTAILAKSTNEDIDILSLQAGDISVAYDVTHENKHKISKSETFVRFIGTKSEYEK